MPQNVHFEMNFLNIMGGVHRLFPNGEGLGTHTPIPYAHTSILGASFSAPEVLISCGSISVSCCCCDSPAALLLSSVVQVEEVCNHSRVVPQVLHCKLRRMALTVEQMLYGVWCHSTLQTDI